MQTRTGTGFFCAARALAAKAHGREQYRVLSVRFGLNSDPHPSQVQTLDIGLAL
jgi:hypothetical protein